MQVVAQRLDPEGEFLGVGLGRAVRRAVARQRDALLDDHCFVARVAQACPAPRS